MATNLPFPLPPTGPANYRPLKIDLDFLCTTIDGLVSTYAPIASPYVTIGAVSLLTAERALTGTSNQIVVTDNGAGSTVVLSTPQNIHTAASPTFSTLNLGAGLTNAPSLTLNDTDTGIFSGGSGRIDFTNNNFNSITIDGSNATFAVPITSTPTTNQLVLGITRTVTITAPTPASSSRTHTIPDVAGNASFVMTLAAQTISGTKTFDGQLIGKGTATNDSAAAGYIGEYIESVVSNVSVPANGVTGDVTSISLTAGDWDVSLNTHIVINGATFTATDYEVWISSTSGNSGTGQVLGSNEAELTTAAVGVSASLSVPCYRISITSTTTYYSKIYVANYTVGTPKAYGRLSARRVR